MEVRRMRGVIGPNGTGIPREGHMCSHRRDFFLTWNKLDGKSASGAWRSNSIKRLLSFVIAIEVLSLITACQTTSTGANTASQKETRLVQAGFKWKIVTTPKQQERVSAFT
jgi:hypothetical protein